MLPSSTAVTAQEAATLALEQLRVVLTFVRDNAAWIGDRMSDLIRAMKIRALDLLIAILDDGSDAAVPLSVAQQIATSESPDVVVPVDAAIESADSVVPVDAATESDTTDATAIASATPVDIDALPIVTAMSDCQVSTTTATVTASATATAAPTVARRCILVVSTWTKAATGAAGTAACYQSLDILRDLRIPVELRELDSVVHRETFLHYKWIAHYSQFPQFFVEDVGTGANCVWVPNENLEEMNHWNGGENYRELTDEELDEQIVPLEHRAKHVFQGVAKHKIGIYHPEDIQAARDRLEIAERQMKAFEDGASEEDVMNMAVLEQLKDERVKTRRSQKKKKKTKTIQRVHKTALGEETK